MIPARSNQTPAPSSPPSSRTPRPSRYRDDPLTREVVRGVTLMSPRPSLEHSHTAFALGLALGHEFARPRKGGGGTPPTWWIVQEPELRLEGEDPVVPDLAGWRLNRIPVPPRGPAMRLAPDWLCEVLSPGTARTDRELKMLVYRDAGVPFVWLADPLQQRLERYELREGAYHCVATDQGDLVVHASPFESLALDLSEIWPPL